jgi:deoxyribodipyrimidine photo-lyase
MSARVIVHWFRQDLRLSDNPALFEASKIGCILPIYILNDYEAKNLGSSSRWWLHHSLNDINNRLNGKLLILNGNPKEILTKLIQNFGVKAVFWNRCYEPHNLHYDEEIISSGMPVKVFNGSLLWEPCDNLKSDGTPYKVFTPFYKVGCLQSKIIPREPLPIPANISLFEHTNESCVDHLGLLPKVRWDKKFEKHWNIGEIAAQNRLNEFLKGGIINYKLGRDIPSTDYVSRLSPYLHFGQLSPNQVWYAAIANGTREEKNLEHFLSELGWREFSYSLLYHFPKLQTENLQQKFDRFPWNDDQSLIDKWQRGQTGYPMVDAGMRELWETGYMHNRVRMIVGSFLVKNLLIHWHHGEKWFWDCLVDADMANNSAGWQWIAGCGADAAPYFRIFNPTTQGEKFDPAGLYIRKYIPEISHLSNAEIFTPWLCKNKSNYPDPIVDLEMSRNKALEALSSIKNSL